MRKNVLITGMIIILLTTILSGCSEDNSRSPQIDESALTISDNFGSGITSIAWNPNGSMLVVTTMGSIIRIWDTTTWHNTINITGHNGSVLMASWNPNGSLLASSSMDRTLRIWDTSSWQEIRVFTENSSWFYYFSWDHNGSRLASSFFGTENVVRIWDTSTWGIISEIDVDSDLQGISWNPNGEEIAISNGRTVEIYDTTTWNIKREFNESDTVHSISYSPDGSKLAIGKGMGTVKIRDTGSWEVLCSKSGYFLDPDFQTLAWSPNSKYLAVWSKGYYADIWDSNNWSNVRQLKGHSNEIYRLAWNPNGTIIVTGEMIMKIWDVSDI